MYHPLLPTVWADVMPACIKPSSPDLITLDMGHDEGTDVPKDLVLPLTELPFQGQAIRVPKDVDGVLRHRSALQTLTMHWRPADAGCPGISANA